MFASGYLPLENIDLYASKQILDAIAFKGEFEWS
ncbi:MAG: hypothetical protein H6Q92_769 [Nitrospirae bacterium]|nr:hypothetical protein [Nitrospirota bacterium]